MPQHALSQEFLCAISLLFHAILFHFFESAICVYFQLAARTENACVCGTGILHDTRIQQPVALLLRNVGCDY